MPRRAVFAPLQRLLADKAKNLGCAPITRIEEVMRKSVWHYQPGAVKPFYKIVCAIPNLVASARGEPPRMHAAPAMQV